MHWKGILMNTKTWKAQLSYIALALGIGIATFGVAMSQLHMEDQQVRAETVKKATAWEATDLALKTTPAAEFFAKEVNSPSFKFIGEGRVVFGPLALNARDALGQFPQSVKVVLNNPSATPIMAEVMAEVAIKDSEHIRSGDSLWVYQVVSTPVNRRTGEAYGEIHEHHIASCQPLDDLKLAKR